MRFSIVDCRSASLPLPSQEPSGSRLSITPYRRSLELSVASPVPAVGLQPSIDLGHVVHGVLRDRLRNADEEMVLQFRIKTPKAETADDFFLPQSSEQFFRFSGRLNHE